MAEGNGLENRRRETVPEFESLLLRHKIQTPCFLEARGFSFFSPAVRGGDDALSLRVEQVGQ